MKRKIVSVYVFDNGMCMVFDQFGEQMPKYQGKWKERKEAILKDKPEDCEVQYGSWRP